MEHLHPAEDEAMQISQLAPLAGLPCENGREGFFFLFEMAEGVTGL